MRNETRITKPDWCLRADQWCLGLCLPSPFSPSLSLSLSLDRFLLLLRSRAGPSRAAGEGADSFAVYRSTPVVRRVDLSPARALGPGHVG
jgi:hypothetical protein